MTALRLDSRQFANWQYRLSPLFFCVTQLTRMKKTCTLLAALWAGMLALPAGAGAAQPAVLNPKQCQALPSQARLPADWEKYRAAVRACPPLGSHGAARVSLLSVFVGEEKTLCP